MRILGLFLAAFAAILIFTGCESNGGYHVSMGSSPPPPPVVIVHEDEHHRHGPPPHAPAHGYRQKHDGCDLVYDRVVGCYSVVGYKNYYYNDGFFFRFGSDGWQVSAHVGGAQARWEVVEEYRVPGGLKAKYKEKGHDKGKGKGNQGHGKGKGHGNEQSMLLLPTVEPIIEARWGKY